MSEQAGITKVEFAVGVRGVLYRAGDSVAWMSGKYKRYGSIRSIEASITDRSKPPAYFAVIRAGHGMARINVRRLEPTTSHPQYTTYTQWLAALERGEVVNGLHMCAEYTGAHRADHRGAEG